MSEISLIEAWNNWIAGVLIPEAKLWGLSLLWWGRFGKLAQFAAALTIIAEIIGPDRIKSFGNSLHDAFSIQKAKKIISDTWAFMRLQMKFLRLSDKDAEKVQDEMEKYWLRWVVSSFALIVIAITIYISYLIWDPWWLFAPSALAGLLFGVVLWFPFVVMLSTFLYISIIIIDVVFLEPIAWLLARKMLDKWIKIGSVILLLTGFHFDLLSS